MAQPLTEGRRLQALDPVDYARGHALFEARSDQRSVIVAWIAERLATRAGASSLAVLSIGCGAGEVEAALAPRVAQQAPAGATRRWTGLDPHAPSVAAYVAALAVVDGADVEGHVTTFEDADLDGGYDVVLVVHSLYYVRDLGDALSRAAGLLRPGGEVLVLHAPRGALNEITADLSPDVAGHPQPWSEEVAAALALLPCVVERVELGAVVDLTGAEDEDPALLAFTVQGELDEADRVLALDRLRAAALLGDGMCLPHPVSAFVVRPTGPAAGAAPRLRSEP